MRLTLRALYGDEKSVEVDDALTVVPAKEESAFPWPGVIVGVLLAVVLAVVSLRMAGRRRA